MAKILLVDDQVAALESLAALLTALEYEVATADSPESAQAVAEQFRPHVAVIDWFLGEGSDGGQVARQLEQCVPRLKYVFVTGTDSRDITSEIDGAHVLCKPFSMEQLVALLESAVSDAND